MVPPAQDTALTRALSRVRELEASLDESRRRAEDLTRILQVTALTNSNLELEKVLEQVALSVQESLGFRIVLLRIRDPKSGVYEARASAGLVPDVFARLRAQEVPDHEFEGWCRPEFRVSRSYYISHTAGFWREGTGYTPDLGSRAKGEWNENDVLFVPLVGRDGRPIGYLSVDDPVDRRIPGREKMQTLETFADQASIAIQNARAVRDLEEAMERTREIAARMRELSRLKSNFVSNVSHELRTPLTSIRAYAETLLSTLGTADTATQAEFLKVINDESERLSRLIDSILDLSRLESGKMKMRRESFDLVALVREVEGILRPVGEKKGLAIRTVSGDPALSFQADRDLVKQVLLNLGGNAIKFTATGGTVTLGVDTAPGHVRLRVEDTGIGIPKEELARVFERFYQVDGGTSRRFGGTGLGLAIARGIVERHGGRLEVESEEGKGTCFTAIFPSDSEVVVVSAETAGPARSEMADDLVRRSTEMTARIMGVGICSLMLKDDVKNDLFIRSAVGLDPSIVAGSRVPMGQAIAGWVALHGKALLIPDIESHPYFGKKNHHQYATRSLLSVPVRNGADIIGVLNVNNKGMRDRFTIYDQYLLSTLADRVGSVLVRARSLEKGEDEARGLLRSLDALLLSAGWIGKGFTSGRLAELAMAVGRHMGLGPEDVSTVGYAARIHDVGMVRLDESLLRVPRPLSEKELKSLRRHPIDSIELLRPLEGESPVLSVILAHHERWDGGGYPGRLAGEEIPVGARVLAVVDAYEAMTVGRPYREPVGCEAALAEIRTCAGRQFDPRVVGALTAVIAGGELREALPGMSGGAAGTGDPGTAQRRTSEEV